VITGLLSVQQNSTVAIFSGSSISSIIQLPLKFGRG